MKPSDVAVDGDSVYVLNIQKNRNQIEIFDRKSGKLVGSIGKTSAEKEGLAIPTNFTLDSKGFLYTTNAGSGKVIKLDKDGHFLLSFGEMGDIVGKFARPKGIAVDHEDRIYVVDGGNQNVQIFNEKGRLLAFFGDPGLLRGSLNLPIGITVTRDNLDYYQKFAAPGFILEAAILVTNQYGAEKITVYGLGQMQGSEGGAATRVPQQGAVEKAKEADKPEPEKVMEKK
jgi:DNA-binding beta-propeller fold protein YncE